MNTINPLKPPVILFNAITLLGLLFLGSFAVIYPHKLQVDAAIAQSLRIERAAERYRVHYNLKKGDKLSIDDLLRSDILDPQAAHEPSIGLIYVLGSVPSDGEPYAVFKCEGTYYPPLDARFRSDRMTTRGMNATPAN